MKTLVLAPQPFYQERGTPIALKLLLETLADGAPNWQDKSTLFRPLELTVLTYHEGEDVELRGITHLRIKPPRWLKNIKPGISLKKILADWFFLCSTLKIIFKNRKNQFELIHCLEEAVFIAWFIKKLFGIPYVYDMDSSLTLQLADSWKVVTPLIPIFEKLEKIAITSSSHVLAVCEALATDAHAKGAKRVSILTDIPTIDLLKISQIDLKGEFNLPKNSKIVLYVGNLQPYQGVELLIESFKQIYHDNQLAYLIIIGGNLKDCNKLLARLHRDYSRILIAGPRPLEDMASYLTQCNILASPRIEGNNTPMKIYNYLASGTPIVATRILSHTQLLNDQIALLAEPNVNDFSKALHQLLQDDQKGKLLAQNALTFINSGYTKEHFKDSVAKIYSEIYLHIKSHSKSGL